MLGSALSATISTYSYHPRSTVLRSPIGPRYVPSDRTLANTANVWGSQVAFDTITIVIKEFWPDIHRRCLVSPRAARVGRNSFEFQVSSFGFERLRSMCSGAHSKLETRNSKLLLLCGCLGWPIRHQFRVQTAERFVYVAIPADRLVSGKNLREFFRP